MSIDQSIPATMMAVRVHPPGGAEAVIVEEIVTPAPSDNEILVKVHAAAVTRDELDWPVDRLPAIPSYELSGTVVDVGASSFARGQPVFGMTDFGRDGVAAEYVALPAAGLSPKPESLSHVEAAALALPGLSAWQGLFDHGHLAPKQRVLIHGGAGGVGAYAVQLARLHGAHVTTTASTARVETAHQLGAHDVIDHRSSDFTTIDPVDLVLDTAGGERLAQSISVLKEGGRLVSVAEDPPFDQNSTEGITTMWYLVESRQDQLDELARLVAAGELQIAVDRTYPLADARTAFEHLQNRGGAGKIVLTVADQAG